MKTGDLAHLFGVSPSTIQNWTRQFEGYLADQKGKQRIYTDVDLITMATIAKLSADGLNYDAIRQQLDSGYRVDSPNEANFGVDTRMVPAAAVEQMIDATEIRIELEQVKAERDKLADLLSQSQRRVDELQAKQDELQQQHKQELKELTAQISDLQYRLGRAEMEAQIRREMEEKRRDE